MLPPTICQRNTPQREMLSSFEKCKAGGRGGGLRPEIPEKGDCYIHQDQHIYISDRSWYWNSARPHLFLKKKEKRLQGSQGMRYGSLCFILNWQSGVIYAFAPFSPSSLTVPCTLWARFSVTSDKPIVDVQSKDEDRGDDKQKIKRAKTKVLEKVGGERNLLAFPLLPWPQMRIFREVEEIRSC